MTSSQESKKPLTLHFNFQQKTFTTPNYYHCWLFKKHLHNPSFYCWLLCWQILRRKSLLSSNSIREGGGSLLREQGNDQKGKNNSDKLIRKIDEIYFPTFSSCCPHNFFAESLLSCQSNHRQTGSKKNWFSFNFFGTKESTMQIYVKNSIWNIQEIVLR